jgi:hypothetical protein
MFTAVSTPFVDPDEPRDCLRVPDAGDYARREQFRVGLPKGAREELLLLRIRCAYGSSPPTLFRGV